MIILENIINLQILQSENPIPSHFVLHQPGPASVDAAAPGYHTSVCLYSNGGDSCLFGTVVLVVVKRINNC